MRPDLVDHFLNLSLEALDLSYVDMYMIHWPTGIKYVGDREFGLSNPSVPFPPSDPTTNLEMIWKRMEAAVTAGKALSIGVSNFNQSQIERILKVATIRPSNSQVELHAYFQQRELVEYCRSQNITTTAYSPLGAPWKKTYPGLL
jgi:alcohol dehydrogenase (NADP+)